MIPNFDKKRHKTGSQIDYMHGEAVKNNGLSRKMHAQYSSHNNNGSRKGNHTTEDIIYQEFRAHREYGNGRNYSNTSYSSQSDNRHRNKQEISTEKTRLEYRNGRNTGNHNNTSYRSQDNNNHRNKQESTTEKKRLDYSNGRNTNNHNNTYSSQSNNNHHDEQESTTKESTLAQERAYRHDESKANHNGKDKSKCETNSYSIADGNNRNNKQESTIPYQNSSEIKNGKYTNNHKTNSHYVHSDNNHKNSHSRDIKSSHMQNAEMSVKPENTMKEMHDNKGGANILQANLIELLKTNIYAETPENPTNTHEEKKDWIQNDSEKANKESMEMVNKNQEKETAGNPTNMNEETKDEKQNSNEVASESFTKFRGFFNYKEKKETTNIEAEKYGVQKPKINSIRSLYESKCIPFSRSNKPSWNRADDQVVLTALIDSFSEEIKQTLKQFYSSLNKEAIYNEAQKFLISCPFASTVLIHRAAELGHPAAMYELAYDFYYGNYEKGIHLDEGRGLEWFYKALKAKHLAARIQEAKNMMTGEFGQKINKELGIKRLKELDPKDALSYIEWFETRGHYE
jgi:hypothetical protein